MRAGRHERHERRPWRPLLLAVLLAVACAKSFAPAENEPRHRTRPVAGASQTLGAGSCDVCHGHQPAPMFHRDCESCHGPGQRHVENVLDPALIRFPASDDCLACHETGHRTSLGWQSSSHADAGVLCSDCHDPHNRKPHHIRSADAVQVAVLRRAGATTQLCASCHAEVAARLSLPSHHPVREGMLGCTDCHEPHASDRQTLGARTDACTPCHQAQAGPWIFEHTPVAEDCSYCHEPHGTSARFLLSQSQPGACISCHTVPELGATHRPEAYVTRCTDCHAAIHGSYENPQLRR